jgi:hypothetical protein
MVWIGIERDFFPVGFFAAIANAIASLVVFCWSGCADGFVVYFSGFMLFVVTSIITDFVQMSRLPREVRTAANYAVALFKDKYPNDRITNYALRAIEPKQIVISVRYQPTGYLVEPTPRRYFGVALPDMVEVMELDQAEWRPRG